MTEETKPKKKWLPVVSDPNEMSRYATGIGGPDVKFEDILGTEDWALDMVEGKTVTVLLLYPIKDKFEASDKEEDACIAKDSQVLPKDIWFTKQTVGNACGTVALLHSFGNIDIPPAKGGSLENFFEKVKDMTPQERAKALESDNLLESAHQTAARESSVKLPAIGEEVNHHFVSFVEKDGFLIELDGRRPFPLNRGKTDSLLKDAVAYIKKEKMDRDPGELGYTLIAVTTNK
eukprot:GHVN01013309.1.p1 GENE.GHVN01013309.1~~GHVN01013309.1.p1  ORF type:complete len:233 (-),score=38.21 GHVN01013309.1:90-788(-)